MFETREKTTLITGGLRGIGRAIADQAAQDKNTIILVQRSVSETIEEELQAIGATQVIQIQKDLTTESAVKELQAELTAQNLSVDILVNNAGLLTGGLIEEQEPTAISKMLDVNIKALILLTQALIPGMLERGSGKIVNNASVSGRMFMPCASTYAASKAGVVAFTNSIRQELKGTGVSTLLLITPGVKTDMYDDIANQYGGHMDLGFLESMPAEEWASKVWRAIQTEKKELLPSGSSRAGLFLAQHFPPLFELAIGRYFSREKKALHGK